MAIYTKDSAAIDFTDGGDTVYEGIDKNETSIDGLVRDLNLAHTTTRGDMIYRAASATARIAIGSAQQRLQSNGTDPAWVPNVNWKRDTKLTYTDSDSVSLSWPNVAWPTSSDAYSAVAVSLTSPSSDHIYWLHMGNTVSSQPSASDFAFSTNSTTSSAIQVGVVLTDGGKNIRKFYNPIPGTYYWDSPLQILTDTGSTTFVNVDFGTSSATTRYAPTDAALAMIRITSDPSTTADIVRLRVDGSADTAGLVACIGSTISAVGQALLDFPLTAGILEYRNSSNGARTNMNMYTHGFKMY